MICLTGAKGGMAVYPGDDTRVGQGLDMQERSERCLQHVESNKITEKHMPTVRYSGEIAVE